MEKARQSFVRVERYDLRKSLSQLNHKLSMFFPPRAEGIILFKDA